MKTSSALPHSSSSSQSFLGISYTKKDERYYLIFHANMLHNSKAVNFLMLSSWASFVSRYYREVRGKYGDWVEQSLEQAPFTFEIVG
jgi:hypothetical protein